MSTWSSAELDRIAAADELEIDAAYRTKYRRYADGDLPLVLRPETRATTLKLVPRTTAS